MGTVYVINNYRWGTKQWQCAWFKFEWETFVGVFTVTEDKLVTRECAKLLLWLWTLCLVGFAIQNLVQAGQKSNLIKLLTEDLAAMEKNVTVGISGNGYISAAL